MKVLIAGLIVLTAHAHEGGHGPQVKNAGKYGGVLTPVIRESGDQTANARVYYKAELVRAENGDLSLYIHDDHMQPIPLVKFPEILNAKMEVKKGGKFVYVGDFSFQKAGTRFVGKLPPVRQRPFNVDVFFPVADGKLFAGFNNLD